MEGEEGLGTTRIRMAEPQPELWKPVGVRSVPLPMPQLDQVTLRGPLLRGHTTGPPPPHHLTAPASLQGSSILAHPYLVDYAEAAL